jgi:hypothetical protein
MSDPTERRHVHANRHERDRALSRVTRATVAGGTGAVLATGALAGWLSTTAHAHAGASSATSPSSSTSSSSSSEQDDDGLQSPTAAPSSASTHSGSQQPTVVSGGS